MKIEVELLPDSFVKIFDSCVVIFKVQVESRLANQLLSQLEGVEKPPSEFSAHQTVGSLADGIEFARGPRGIHLCVPKIDLSPS